MMIHDAPARVATGVYILHSGLEKWHGDEQRAAGLHGFASGAYPMLRNVPPRKFMRMLSVAEITVGAALLTPLVRHRLAGALLTTFSGALLGVYWRSANMHEPHSVWPTQAGTALSKDVWMFGIGTSLLMESSGKAAA